MTEKIVTLLTHVRHFVGPGTVRRLLSEDITVVCQDASFADADARAASPAEVPGAEICAATGPAEIVAEIIDRFHRIDSLVSNDPYPAIRAPIDEADPAELRRAMEALARCVSIAPRAFPVLSSRPPRDGAILVRNPG